MKNESVKRILEVVLCVVLILVTLISYNTLVRLSNEVKEQKAQIENVLQARIMKIPDLVSSAKALMAHEEKVFTAIAEARKELNTALGSGDLAKIAEAEDNFSVAYENFTITVENYPELKSDEVFVMLFDEISESVNKISVERRNYNKVVTKYNNTVQTFPMIIFARLMDYQPAEYFEASPEAHETNVVDFGN